MILSTFSIENHNRNENFHFNDNDPSVRCIFLLQVSIRKVISIILIINILLVERISASLGAKVSIIVDSDDNFTLKSDNDDLPLSKQVTLYIDKWGDTNHCRSLDEKKCNSHDYDTCYWCQKSNGEMECLMEEDVAFCGESKVCYDLDAAPLNCILFKGCKIYQRRGRCNDHWYCNWCIEDRFQGTDNPDIYGSCYTRWMPWPFSSPIGCQKNKFFKSDYNDGDNIPMTSIKIEAKRQIPFLEDLPSSTKLILSNEDKYNQIIFPSTIHGAGGREQINPFRKSTF